MCGSGCVVAAVVGVCVWRGVFSSHVLIFHLCRGGVFERGVMGCNEVL